MIIHHRARRSHLNGYRSWHHICSPPLRALRLGEIESESEREELCLADRQWAERKGPAIECENYGNQAANIHGRQISSQIRSVASLDSLPRSVLAIDGL